jgi:hypothetical protein
VRRRTAVLLLLLAAACDDDGSRLDRDAEPAAGKENDDGPPARVVFDRILIAFKGSYARGGEVFRSREQARDLAYRLLDRIRSGVEFDLLKEEYTDDRARRTGVALGPYGAFNHGVSPKKGELGDIPRENFYPALAGVIFKLQVGEVGMADHHPKDCPDGWHIVKRLE